MMPRSAIIPCLRYRDAPAAIDFLVSAFGFNRHAVYADEGDPRVILHAQLVRDGYMVMLGSDRPGDVKARYRWMTPGEAGGVTQCICVVVDDPDSHASQARAAGAEIIAEPADNQGYPGRGYDARDTEGNVWNFTSYDPWAEAG